MAVGHGVLTKSLERKKLERNRQLLAEIVQEKNISELPPERASIAESKVAERPTNTGFREIATKKLK